MARRMAYFSDVSGQLIDESERAVLTIRNPDGTTVKLEGAESELRLSAPPKREMQLASVRVSYPQLSGQRGTQGQRKEAVSYRVPVGQLKQVLPVDALRAMQNMQRADGAASDAPRAASGRTQTARWACPECDKTFGTEGWLTRHLRSAHKATSAQVAAAVAAHEEQAAT